MAKKKPAERKYVRSLKRLMELAAQRRSVTDNFAACKFGKRHLPAALLQNWPAAVLYRMLGNGVVWEYTPKRTD